MIQSPEAAYDILTRIRERGIRISLYQYGEYSGSLTLLRRMPLDLVRLSHKFLQEELEREGGLELLKGLTAVVRSLNMEIGAEKIEDPEEEAVLKKLHCSRVSGLLYGEPLPGGKIRL